VRGALDGETPGRGRDRPAFQEHDPAELLIGSISNEHTFPADLSESVQVDQQLLGLVERVCWRARKRGVRARTVTLKLRYSDFHTVQRSRTGLASSEEGEVLAMARLLLRRAWSRRAAIRLLGIALSNLVGNERQLCLPFDAIGSSPSGAVDLVRQRFGYAAIRRGRADDGRER
jgi:DNA polymerase-4